MTSWREAAYCYRRRTFRGLCVCVLGISVSAAKTDETIELPHGPGNQQRSAHERSLFIMTQAARTMVYVQSMTVTTKPCLPFMSNKSVFSFLRQP